MTHRHPHRLDLVARLLLVVAIVTAVVGISAPTPSSAAVQVNGSGSTWSAIAVTQWAADVARRGLSINYTPNGSSTGRKFYIEGDSDFAVSEIPFQPETRDRTGAVIYDEIARASARPYAYLPIVAGGTSFMYHLVVNGQRVTNLRLSGETVTKIFTGVITNWNDPAITAENGRAFPSKTIKPMVRSDGSGTSAQFSAYMASVYPDLWRAFCAKTGLTPCGQTSLYPIFDGSQAQQGSDGVSGAVASSYNDGAITYVEYGYAKQKGFPVASVRNQAGYYVQPTAGNVAIALTRAQIKSDRTQVLTEVYRNPDRRTYPVSSYSYMIVPTSEADGFTAELGASLGQFILYFLCTGQQKAEVLGYSPLPKNLVQFAFDAERLIPGAPAPPPIDKCANPTITGAFSTANAPQPPPDADPNVTPGGNGPGGTNLPVGRVGGDGGNGPAAGGTDTDTTVVDGGTTDTTVAGEDTTVSSDTVAAEDGGGGASSGTGSAAEATETASPAELAAATAASKRGQDTVSNVVYVLSALVVMLAIFGPPALSAALRRRRR